MQWQRRLSCELLVGQEQGTMQAGGCACGAAPFVTTVQLPAMKKPLPPLAIAFCCGLAVTNCFPVRPMPVWMAIAAVCLACLWLCCCKSRRPATLSVVLLFFLLGVMALVPWRSPRHGPNHIIHRAGKERVQVEGIIDEPPVLTTRNLRIYLTAVNVHTPEFTEAVSGRVMVSIRKPCRTWRYGDRVRFFCRLRKPCNFENPGRFDYVRHLAYQAVFVTASLEDDKAVSIVRAGEGNGFLLLVESYRERIRAMLDQEVSAPARDIIKALILGQQGTIPENVRDQFAILGLSHILAISGLNIGIVALVSCWLFLGLMKLYPRLLLRVDAFRLAVMLSVLPAAFYCFIAGLQIPTLRSFVMIMTYVLALLFGRRQDLLSTLCLAALLILVWMPTSLFDISFQLSFVAVLSLVLILPVLQPLIRRPLPGCESRLLARAFTVGAGLFLTSAVATLGTAPLVAGNFHRFAWMGLFTNILMVPYTGFLIVPLGLVAALLVPISAALAQALFACAGALTDELLVLTAAWSRLGLADLRLAVPAWWEAVLVYSLLFGFPFCLKRRKMNYWVGIVALFLLLEVLAVCARVQGPGSLRVTFFDVGHGDAALIRFPGNTVMLIDGGGSRNEDFDVGRAVIAPALYHLGIRSVDYLVLSHPHQDHAGGLAYILEHFNAKELWLTQTALAEMAEQRLVLAARRNGVRQRILSADANPMLIEGVCISILNPLENKGRSLAAGQKDANNDSLVMRVGFKDVGFLFTGDIRGERERMLVHAERPLQATVLKVPHHGRSGSSLPEFVNTIAPQIAVISCRPFGREEVPAAAVLETYRQARAQVYRTDLHGAVTITTDGSAYSIEPWITADGTSGQHGEVY